MKIFNLPNISKNAFMKVMSLKMDMENKFSNIEIIVGTKEIKVGKYRASYKLSIYKSRTYKVHSYYVVKQFRKKKRLYIKETLCLFFLIGQEWYLIS